MKNNWFILGLLGLLGFVVLKGSGGAASALGGKKQLTVNNPPASPSALAPYVAQFAPGNADAALAASAFSAAPGLITGITNLFKGWGSTPKVNNGAVSTVGSPSNATDDLIAQRSLAALNYETDFGGLTNEELSIT